MSTPVACHALPSLIGILACMCAFVKGNIQQLTESFSVIVHNNTLQLTGGSIQCSTLNQAAACVCLAKTHLCMYTCPHTHLCALISLKAYALHCCRCNAPGLGKPEFRCVAVRVHSSFIMSYQGCVAHIKSLYIDTAYDLPNCMALSPSLDCCCPLS